MAQREALCRNLLDEFGAKITRHYKDELVHGCLLPWGNHTDQGKNPSASLNYDKLTYKCLGCQGGGGLLWFIAACRGTTGDEARAWLAKETGQGQVQELSALLAYFDAVYAPKARRPPISTYAERVLDPWLLIHPYMTEVRGIPEETLIRFKVGYDEHHPVGDGKTSERIVIPVFFNGKLVGWQTRRLGDDGTPKYLSSAEFPKDRTLYNHDPRARRRLVVVESALSVLSKFHVIPDVGATFGATVTDDQIKLMAKYDEVIIWPDNDDAGWNSVVGLVTVNPKSGKKAVVSEGVGQRLIPFTKVKVVQSPFAGDPCDVDDDTAANLVDQAVPFSIWSPPTTLRQFEGVKIA